MSPHPSSPATRWDSDTSLSAAPEVDEDDDEKFVDSGMLAKLTSRLHGQAPGLVGQLRGGGGMKGNPLAKGALGGIAATAAKRFLGK